MELAAPADERRHPSVSDASDLSTQQMYQDVLRRLSELAGTEGTVEELFDQIRRNRAQDRVDIDLKAREQSSAWLNEQIEELKETWERNASHRHAREAERVAKEAAELRAKEVKEALSDTRQEFADQLQRANADADVRRENDLKQAKTEHEAQISAISANFERSYQQQLEEARRKAVEDCAKAHSTDIGNLQLIADQKREKEVLQAKASAESAVADQINALRQEISDLSARAKAAEDELQTVQAARAAVSDETAVENMLDEALGMDAVC